METFSRDELIAALRFVLEEEDAVEIASGAFEMGEEARLRAAAAGRSAEEQAIIHLGAMNLNEDTLIVLALASQKGARCVQTFRSSLQRLGGASVELQGQTDTRWIARYAQLAAALTTGWE